MKARVKRLWLKALRSGEYKQGTAWLKNGERFCCLGVLCDVYRDRTQRGEWEERPVGARFKTERNSESALLPTLVMEWAGLETRDPRLGRTHRALSASSLNDRGYSFSQIAERIEKYL